VVCEVTTPGDTTPPAVLYIERRIIELAVTYALLTVVLEEEDSSEIPKKPTLAPEPFAGDPRPNILCGINDISINMLFF
jgi:hypothetical protein